MKQFKPRDTDSTMAALGKIDRREGELWKIGERESDTHGPAVT
jgi:hypothetical protein